LWFAEAAAEEAPEDMALEPMRLKYNLKSILIG